MIERRAWNGEGSSTKQRNEGGVQELQEEGEQYAHHGYIYGKH